MIQVELNGELVEVTKHQLFALAERGQIGPETRIVASGKESTAGKAKGIEFGTEGNPIPPIKDDMFEWDKIQEWEKEQKKLEQEEGRTWQKKTKNVSFNSKEMKSVFPHLAALGPMLMRYNFIFFLFSAFTTCGTLWSLYGTGSIVPVAIGLFFLFGWYLFWRTIFGSVSDMATLAYSLHQNSIEQTELLKETGQ